MAADRLAGWRRLAQHWLVPAGLLALGAAIRLALAARMPADTFARGEIANTAIAFAQTGVLADAYQVGQGPTAHVLPFPPIYAGLIYRALGIHSAPAEAVLTIIAVALALGSFALLYRSFGIMGTPRPLRLAALAFLCLLPLNSNLEIVVFRIWEGALAVCMASGYLLALLVLERRETVGWLAVAVMSVAAALLFFVSPPLGLAGYAGSLLLLIAKLPVRRWAGATALAIAGLALVITPWALRNQAVMGEALLLRSNFGLELALGNHPDAVTNPDQRQAMRDRLEVIHPYESKAAFAAMQAAGGEVAYARKLGDEAKAWIASDPRGFATLCVRHLQQFFFPPGWLWNIYSDKGMATGFKVWSNAALSVLGLAGALVAGLVAWRRYRFAILMLVLPVLPFIITQPVLRYRYIIFALSAYFAADLAARLLRRLGLLAPEPDGSAGRF
ncbi:MAG: hypothetical protein ACRCUI_09370 [Polymorphobacter sp.]